MSKFRFSGRVKRVTVEYIDIEDGIIDVTKKEVCSTFDLPSAVDGDPQHWVDEAEQAVDYGAEFKVADTGGANWELSSVSCTAEQIEDMEYDV